MGYDTANQALKLLEGYKNKSLAGTVVANEDPLNLDRIQVRIPGLYDPDLGEVPWCGPAKSSPFGCGDGYGVYGVPAVGSDVAISFQNGDPQYPVYEFDILAYANDEFPSGTAWGFSDPDGNKLKVEGQHITFTSGSGLVIDIDEDGKLTVTAPSDVEMTISGDLTIDVDGDTNLTTNKLTVEGDVEINGDVETTGTLKNNSHDVGSTHKHLAVTPGSGQSGIPV